MKRRDLIKLFENNGGSSTEMAVIMMFIEKEKKQKLSPGIVKSTKTLQRQL